MARSNAMGAGVVALAFWAGAACANPLAIWDTYPKLTCRYDVGQQCNPDFTGCQLAEGKAVLLFDFKAKVVSNFSSPKLRPILGFYHFASDISGFPDTNVVMESGALYTFMRIDRPTIPSEKDTVEAVVQSANIYSIFSMRMTCHPA